MELLYIWIEDYKNIHHQGFNFSPEYQFEFKPTEVEDQKELSGTVQRVKSGILRNLKQNGTAIKDFFQPSEEVKTYWKEKRPDENLGTISNVTAVIGKNGSGKSNLLKFILDRIVPYIKNHLKDDPGKLGETPRDFLFIFRKAKKIYYFSWKLKVGMEAKEILELVTDPKMIENCVLCYYSSMISSTQKSFRNFHYGNGDTIHFVSLSDDSFLEGLSLDEYRRQDLRRHIEFVHLKREILLPFSILEAMYFFVNRDYEDELNEGTGNDLTNSLINFFKDFKTGYLSDYTIKKELEVINVFRIIKSIIIGDCKYLLEIESATWMRFFSDICNQGEINFENVNTFLKDQS
ncbi:MAG TPA: hypothetical protein PKA14_18840, partial [Leptospiraceae bacterium]|nr:hypothetical protein [Leptospiraceae bacterium]